MGGIHNTAAPLVILILQTFTAVYCQTSAAGLNSLYSGLFISYDTSHPFWTYPSYSKTCSGCTCNEQESTVTGCSGNVVLVSYAFEHITNNSFSSSLTSLTIAHVSSFKSWSPNAFEDHPDLTSITVHGTGLVQFPEVSQANNSRLTTMILRNNRIKFFAHNKTTIDWPDSLTVLCLEGNDIDYIPNGFFSGSKLEYVRLNSNNILVFPGEVFSGVTTLVYLGVTSNMISGISIGHIQYLASSPNFQHLDVGNNNIKYISPGALALFSNLKIFEAYNNEMFECRSGVFANLPELLHLDLASNKLKILGSSCLTDMQKLMTLKLQSQVDKMTNIYFDAFININDSLRYLYLSGNALTSFPHQVLSEQTYNLLREVYADDNRISNITDYTLDGFPAPRRRLYILKLNYFTLWSTSPNIQKFLLGNNLITEILSSYLCPLKELRVLELQSNLLTDGKVSDDAFDCLAQLYFLQLSSNQFSYVPKSVRSSNLTSLQHLYLSSNRLTFIEVETFVHLPALQSLDISSNKIIVVENGSFPNSITTLLLNNNEFRFTHENPFNNLTNLANLRLQNNKISLIPDTAFHGCTSLTELYINDNNIGWLKKVMFQDNPFAEFYATNNDIGHIEDGTFSHLTSISHLHLSNNKLTRFPEGGSFANITVYKFSLNNNRFTETQSKVFEGLRVTDTLNLASSELSTIETNAFKDVSISSHLYLNGNPMRNIQTGAFLDFSCRDLYLQGMGITHIPSGAFERVSAYNMYLSGNTMSSIEQGAFVNIRVTHDLHLQGMQITHIPTGAFQLVSARHVYLSSNNISYIEDGAFSDVALSNNLYLSSNRISSFRGGLFNRTSIGGRLDLSNNAINLLYSQTFSGLTYVREVDLSSNAIHTISLAAFLNQNGMEYLDLSHNKLTRISKGTLDPLTTMTTLDLSNNEIENIDPEIFSTMTQLRTLDLSSNELFTFYQLPLLPQLISLDLSSNLLKSVEHEAFVNFESNVTFTTLTLSGNDEIGCDCYAYDTLDKVSHKITGGACGSPAAVHGSLLGFSSQDSPTYFLNTDRNAFLCSPINVQATSPTATDITVTWERPESPVLPAINVTDNETSTWSYQVKCENRVTGNIHIATVATTTHTFSGNGIANNTEYICDVSLIIGTNLTRLSAASQPSFVVTQLVTGEGSSSGHVGDYTVPVKYYDFSITHTDFGTHDTTFISKPTYVPSPYGSWLMKPGSSTPTTDTFSTWFVYKSGINQEITSNLTLSLVTVSPPTHRFADNNFFPIDDTGYGKQEKDCLNNDHNMGFTSAIRTGMVYQGSETLAVGGGDDMWVYLNGVLILEIETRNSGTQIPCKIIDLSAASVSGGATIFPQSGFVINSQCVTVTNETTENINLNLEVGERYHFTIFHAERLTCASSLFIETKNFQFILAANEEPPRDYVQLKAEDLHADAIVQEIVLVDVFSSSGPYEVTIISGNEARHFTLVDDTTANRNKDVSPPPVTYNYTTVNGVSFVECSSPSTITPEGNNPSTEQFTITTAYALLTLDLSLDYEVKTLYPVIMEVKDTGRTPQTTGTITTKIRILDVNDNCPELTQTSYSIVPYPTLQSSALAQLNASDIDTGDNSDLAFSLSTVIEEPVVTSESMKSVSNGTLKFNVIVTDNGYPVRGAQAVFELTIGHSCLYDVEYGPIDYSVTVDNTSGEVYYRLPKYYHAEDACMDDLGLESGLMLDSQIVASSSNIFSRSHRARLNMKATTPQFGSLTGGWQANIDDTNQWLQISFNEITRVNKIKIQGQEEADNWVTTFTLTYSSDGTTWHTFVNDTGLSILNGATDRSSVTELTLSPTIITMHVRVNPKTWNNHIAMRLDLVGCTQQEYDYHKTTCLGCLTTNYCVGDGTMLPCGRCDPPQSGSTCGRSPTEHSFGMASECSPCPKGWKCSDGYAEKCPQYHYIVCNTTYCPSSCTKCESGYVCRDGKRTQCGIGNYATGDSEYCQLCDSGTYQDKVAQSSCKNCTAGYYSTRMKDKCNPCLSSSYADDKGSGCELCGPECLCKGSNGTLCYSEDLCYNKKVGGVFSHGCLPCPDGFTGDGVTCSDIDECADNNPCWNQSCVNTSPGYQCKACPLGYKGTYEDALTWTIYRRVFEEKNEERAALDYQTCNDVNECNVNYGGCDPNSYCHNTVGSHHCGTCKTGYLTSPIGTCILADFCLSGDYTCDSNAECVYMSPGEYKCVCKTGWSGDGKMCGVDYDMDGKSDKGVGCTAPTCSKDNCVSVPNSGQEDADGDSAGDACDNDADNDSRYGSGDNCPTVANNDQADGDSDGVGDVCDNCVSNSNSDQADLDKDGVGDVCDTDKDGDGVLDASDNCPLVANAGQTDGDGDVVGDSCDNCPSTSNSAQTDSDGDGIGDSCSNQDKDGDGLEASVDNCDELANGGQTDTDSDGLGDYCDVDIDGDGTLNVDDNCVYVSNPSQTDLDGNHRGDVCEGDEDNDGTIDKEDNCPRNKNINDTSLSNFITLDFNPALTSESDASWLLQDSGRDIRQTAKTLKPVALIGNQYFDHVKFMGTTYTDTVDDCYGYIGFIFGFRGSRKYYLVSWRHMQLSMNSKGATKGVQLWLINSATTLGSTSTDALFHSSATTGVSELLWQDPRLIGWECATPYRWTIEHSPSIGLIRVLVEERETTVADSGYVYDVTIPGGRLGVFSFNQTGSVWSNLQYECTDRRNFALELNGNSYGVIGNMASLSIDKSFTIEVWVYLESGHPSTKLPIVCTNSSELCLYVEGGVFKTQIGSTVISGTTTITTNAWTHITTRYNAQRGILTMFLARNSGVSKEAEVTDMAEINWNSGMDLYLGRDASYFFRGKIDELRIYNIQIPDAEVDSYWQKVGMSRDYNKYTLRAHYTMDNSTDTSVLMDQSLNKVDVTLHGSPQFVESSVDYYRYFHTYG